MLNNWYVTLNVKTLMKTLILFWDTKIIATGKKTSMKEKSSEYFLTAKIYILLLYL